MGFGKKTPHNTKLPGLVSTTAETQPGENGVQHAPPTGSGRYMPDPLWLSKQLSPRNSLKQLGTNIVPFCKKLWAVNQNKGNS